MSKKRKCKGSTKRDLALRQAAALLREANAIGEVAIQPDFDGFALIERSLKLLTAIEELRTQNPRGLITAAEIQALSRGTGDKVH